MCFHTSQTKKTIELENRFDVSLVDDALRDYFDTPRYHLNGFSHPNMLVIPQEKSNVLAPGVWGIVPSNKTKEQIKPYYKEAVKYGSGLNARSEKVFNHFVYRGSIMENRCIIPVSGFFEPHDHKGKKYPFHFKDKEDKPLALAGLYTVIDTFITFTILTKDASPLFAKIHNKKNRQPVLLNMEYAHNWLSTDLNESDIKEVLNYTYKEEALDAYPVSKNLFSPKENSDVPSILEKVEYEGLEI
ncbi:SOS response-associated peptidase [Pontimicrobium aquaticum]|uniref:Abasic site processing protein n=1 Tax=Pontimicrobium aquaticum TaxID=2565367 RepID=A0A4U0EX08_9FLAO|nr:SOS response-associated peptidase [Pontimicrobium aquaticum]TJY35894.1 SOS response-associated peptidase [Pontimicrobium aquaticum]